EHSFRKIVVQSFLDPSRFPVPSIIKRIQVMLTIGINNLAEALREGRIESLHEVSRMETKIDELYFLCIRQIFFSVKREVWGEEAAHPYIGAIGDRLVVRALEEIADSIKLASDETFKLIEKELPKPVVNKLVKLLESIQVVFGKTMKAFLSLDIQLANEIIDITTQEYGEEMAFNDVFPQNLHDVTLTISLRNFVYNIVNIARNCKMIAEVTINRFVRLPSKMITVEKV
ncbi:MAG: PhoU domain-containing protein, partial [Candidatus Caldarchaeum sp.]